LFGEKYGDSVRCVVIGDKTEPESIELCGGTHCRATGEIGQFLIVSESSVGSGLRRIEGLTGLSARHLSKKRQEILSEAAEILKTSEQEIVSKIQKNIEEKKKLERELAKARNAAVCGSVSQNEGIIEVAGTKLLAKKLEAASPDELRNLVDVFKGKIKSGIVALGAVINEKPLVFISVTDDLKSKYDACLLARETAKIIGGGGGGRKEFAQVGGKDPAKLDEALKSLAAIIASKP
jgi:alanyl-tRNA synthetase